MRWVTAVATLALAFGVAGCGDDDEGDETTAADTPQESAETTTSEGGGGGETVKISLVDFAIEPSEVTVAPGEVTFDAANDGQTPHNLEIEGEGLEEELPADLAAGESGSLTVDLAAGTTYEMYCPVADHAELGMTGEVTVEGESGGVTTTTPEEEAESGTETEDESSSRTY